MAGSLQQSPSREHSLANSTTATPPLPPSDPAPKSEPADEDLGSQTPPRPVAGCAHLEELDTDATAHLLKRYISGLRWGHQIRSGATSQHSANDSGRAGKRRKLLPYPSCGTCEITLHRPYICTDCAYTACSFSDGAEGHMGLHLAEEGHSFAFDIHSGALLCAACDDIIYDPRFEAVLRTEKARATSRKSTGSGSGKSGSSGKDPVLNVALPETNGARGVCRVPRGLRNMGATCFMNVILQSFIHNPLLRNFFLSDRHNPALCGGRENCLACEMDKMFTEFFSSTSGNGPHGPTTFLFCMWLARESSELTQAGQHDAHELFISALNGIHGALVSRGDRSGLPVFPYEQLPASNTSWNDENGCPCVVHRSFSGQLQSDVTCQRCGKVNSTRDPMLDLSLDVRPARLRGAADSGSAAGDETKKPKQAKKNAEKERKLAGRESTDEEQHLLTCLQRYCSSEKLGAADYSCAHCGSGSQASKQLSLFRLPPVLCIQLKRFEHTSAAAKIDTRVRFPFRLDMREFCTPSIRAGGAGMSAEPDAYAYDLCTAVVHEGSMNTGHYTNFSKWRDEWYRFDDDKVTPASLAEVLGARAYQLCYVRRSLQHARSKGGFLSGVGGVEPSKEEAVGCAVGQFDY